MEKTFYFDNAATTFPKPEIVYKTMDSFYRIQGGSSGRGQYKLSALSSKVIFECRENLKILLNAQNKGVIFTPSATIALNMVIQGKIRELINDKNFIKIATVYITPFEHNSVTRVLHHFEKCKKINVKKIAVTKMFEYDLGEIKNQFEKNPPNIVIVSHASNVIGLVAPVLEIFNLAKQYKAITICDMAQTAGLVPLDLNNQNVDFAIFAGHKTLYGPFGIGGIIKNPECNLEPILFGGTGVESINQDMPSDVPARYEMGSQNGVAIAGLGAAVNWFLKNAAEIRAKEEKNHNQLLDILSEYDFIKIVGPNHEIRKNCIGVVSAVFEDYSADSIGNVLDEFSIAVRTGLQCSPLAHDFLGTSPAGTVRFSVGYFTSEEDFAMLRRALDYIKQNY